MLKILALNILHSSIFRTYLSATPASYQMKEDRRNNLLLFLSFISFILSLITTNAYTAAWVDEDDNVLVNAKRATNLGGAKVISGVVYQEKLRNRFVYYS